MIRAVLFDFGDTLMYSPHPWPAVMMQAGRNLSTWLINNGIAVNPKTFHLEFLQKLDAYYEERDRTLTESTSMVVLQKLLAKKGYRALRQDILRGALDRFYEVTQTNWFLERDAQEALKTLQNSAIRLGMISNAADETDVIQQAEKFGIRPYFDFIITSAACGYRKPHPRIFQLALDTWGLPAGQIAMVGDRLEADISGAKNMGITTIWIKRRAKTLPGSAVTPDYTADNLKGVTEIILQHHN